MNTHDIEILELSYKNILSVGNNIITIDFSNLKNLFITGSNGSGKSTLVTALTYNLYGKADRDINKSGLINITNGRELYTKTKLKIKGKIYAIERGIKPDVLKVTEDDVEWLESSSKTDYDKRIIELLGCDLNTFQKLVVISDTTYTSLMKMKTAERREFVENILDIKTFTNLQSLAKETVKDLKIKISTLDNEYKTLKTYIDRDVDRIEQQKIQNKLNIDKYILVIKDINELEIPKLTNQKIQDIKFIESEINELESSDNNQEKNRIQQEIQSNEKRLAELKNELSKININNDSTTELENELFELNTKIRQKTQEINNTTVSIKIIEQDGKKIKQQLTDIDSDSNCPTCYQKLVNDDLKNILSDKRNDLIISYKEKKNLLDLYVIEQNVLNDRLKLVNDSITSYKHSKLSYDNKVKEISNLEITIKNLKDRDLDSVKNNKIIVLTERLNNVKNKDYLFEINIRLNNLKEKLLELESVTFDNTTIENDKIKLKDKEEELRILNNDLKHEQFLVSIFDDKGIKANVIEMFIPFLNQRINYYLRKFEVDIDFRLDNQFNERVLLDFMNLVSYNNLSEGQKQRIDLAITFAFLDVAISRNYASFNLLFLDDMTGKLDEKGVTEMLNLIENDMKNTTPILINHDRDKYQHIFNKIINFYQDGKFTKHEIL